eukprot:Nk52_evm26s2622 gene=Nk52_evmTU26s2622
MSGILSRSMKRLAHVATSRSVSQQQAPRFFSQLARQQQHLHQQLLSRPTWVCGGWAQHHKAGFHMSAVTGEEAKAKKDEETPIVEGEKVEKKTGGEERIPTDEEFKQFMAEAQEAAAKEEEKEAEQKEELIEETEKVTGTQSHHEFKAETKKLLDIVAKSLYSEKEVFIREIVSNASDAIEKLRHLQVTEQEISDPELPLKINISVDKEKKLFIIQDTGIGMTEQELVDNLGMIAQSGSKAFLEQLESTSASAKDNIIGQFGVGFYSTFMVGDRVKVYTKSAKPGSKGYCWSSTGDGSYDIAEAEGVQRGTKIIIELKDDALDYSKKTPVSKILKQYSNFVGHPIHLNGEELNTLQPLWTLSPSDITDEQHKEFYKFVFHAWDDPKYNFQFTTDAPLSIKSLFYIPTTHTEKMGMGRMDPGVNLYCRKVLIQSKAPKLLPEWMRFVKGIVDSEDIPLNLSRELLQDSALMRKMSSLLATKIVKFLVRQGKKDDEKYQTFFKEFGNFIREGVCTDRDNQKDIASLLRYETSTTEKDSVISLDTYMARKPETQKSIYYLNAPSRAVAESSPYFESFKQKNIEVLFLYEPFDDYVMNNLLEFKGAKLVSIENDDALKDLDVDGNDDVTKSSEALRAWLKDALGDKVKEVKASSRLVSSPAIIVGHQSAMMRNMMKMINKDQVMELEPQVLEINPEHELLKKLAEVKDKDEETARTVAEQLLDNALIAAGLIDDPRSMVDRLNKLMGIAMRAPKA